MQDFQCPYCLTGHTCASVPSNEWDRVDRRLIEPHTEETQVGCSYCGKVFEVRRESQFTTREIAQEIGHDEYGKVFMGLGGW